MKELFVNPQRFMDQVAAILKNELHRLLIDGIKYERIAPDGPGASWEMTLFDNEELVNYLTSLEVKHSVYEYVVYDSEVEREFARQLDARADIKLFVKLPVGSRSKPRSAPTIPTGPSSSTTARRCTSLGKRKARRTSSSCARRKPTRSAAA